MWRLCGRKGLAFLHCTVLESMSSCLVEGGMMGVSGSFSFTSLHCLTSKFSLEVSGKFAKSCQAQCLIHELCIKKTNQKNGHASDGQNKYINERSC